jgi:hypothetical protein
VRTENLNFFSSKKGFRRGFKADKKYAKRHGALMFVQRGPFNWTKLHFAVWKDDLNAVKGHVEVDDTSKLFLKQINLACVQYQWCAVEILQGFPLK